LADRRQSADEGRAAGERDRESDASGRRGPAPIVALDDRQRQRADTGGGEQRRQRIGPWNVVTGGRWKPEPGDQKGDKADRHVDQEDPAPAHGNQHAADDRSERGGEAADRGPGPHRPAAAFRREGRQQEADRSRGHERSAGRPKNAASDQRPDAAGACAGGRGDGEERDAEEEAAIAPMAFGQPAEKDEQRGICDRVAVQHPGQVFEGRAGKIMRDRGKPNIDDEEIEVGEHDADADDRQHLARAGPAEAAQTPRGGASGAITSLPCSGATRLG